MERGSMTSAVCPVLAHIREIALVFLRKRDRAAVLAINLEGTKVEGAELARAQIILEAFHPEATIRPHPLGAVWALKVAEVPFIGKPNAMPRTSAQRRKFFVAALKRAMAVQPNEPVLP
jgi:hypothetical protein